CDVITSMVAFAAAQEIGFPPNVEIFPAVQASAMGAVATTALMGNPLAMPLAIVITSGSTPSWSAPHIVPARPKPVWTSSKMKMPPYFRTIDATSGIHPGGGVMKPPTPRIGSTIAPAMRPDVVVWIISSMSVAHFKLQLGYRRSKGHR